MLADSEKLVVVQREWDGWHTSLVRLSDLENVHWFQPHHAPRPLLHAEVVCTNIREGDIPHNCEVTPPPHRLTVCVLKRHISASVFADLAARADQRAGVPGFVRPPDATVLTGGRPTA
jgi:hypothetical protein